MWKTDANQENSRKEPCLKSVDKQRILSKVIHKLFNFLFDCFDF